MLSCFFDRTWECSGLEWVCWCRVTQAVLCPHMLTSPIADHSWDRLEPESASSHLSEQEKRERGLRLGWLPKPCVLWNRAAQSEPETLSWTELPFLRESQHLCTVVTTTVFPLSEPSVQRLTQSHDCCGRGWLLLRVQKCSHYYIHIFCFLLHYKDKHFLPFTAVSCSWVERWTTCLFRHVSPQEDWKIRGGLA